jgi:methylmalonyl-CoA mutase
MQLAADFPPVSHDDWLEAVAKVLKGRAFDKVLRSATPDGIVIDPLYTRDDADVADQVPGAGVSRRATNVAGQTAGWDVRQRHSLTTPAATNAAILTDLSRGVTSIELDMAGIGADELDAVLANVLLDLAPISLRAASDGVAEGLSLLALADARGVPAGEFRADLGCDPIGCLAVHGAVGRPIDEALGRVGALAAQLATTRSGVRIVRADGVPFAEAGATPATELAATVASGLAYLRALDEAGVEPAVAVRQILLSVTVGTDQFGDIAKLRALRVMWARVNEVLGTDAPCAIQASTAAAVMTRLDPWVNMLRVTIGCFAAAVGGADIVQVRPFDTIAGAPDDLGLRVARNTQLTLMEESNLHRVIDPAGGSWYVEELTNALAAEAWEIVQDIERRGGIVAALTDDSLQQRVDAAWTTTAGAVATRQRPITGVSEFPAIDEELLERPALADRAVDLGPATVRPLTVRRLAEPYETLRLNAGSSSPLPTVFLANLGPVAVHTARAAWAKNFFEVGGIAAVQTPGFDDDAALAEAFRADASRVAVLCSSDDVYADRAATAASALKAAGAERVYLAGHPGDRRQSDEAGGVDEFVHVGTDVLASLEHAHRLLGIGTEEAAR